MQLRRLRRSLTRRRADIGVGTVIRPQPSRGPKAFLAMLVAGRGYANYDIDGPFSTQRHEQHYIVTIYAGDSLAVVTLRGTITELQDRIAAMPRQM